jgi:hypothetical protein
MDAARFFMADLASLAMGPQITTDANGGRTSRCGWGSAASPA